MLPLWAENLAVFDTETTGIDVADARIVSACIALMNGAGEVVERYDWLVDPGVDIPAVAAAVHGISTEVARRSGVEAAVGVAQIRDRLSEMVGRGFPLVVYNAPFDLTLLGAECDRHGLPRLDADAPVVDPLVIDKQMDRFRKGKRTLEAVAQHYGVPLDAAHDAGEDAIAAGRIAQALARRFASALPDDAEALHRAQQGWAKQQAESLQAYLRRVRNPSAVVDGGWPHRLPA